MSTSSTSNSDRISTLRRRCLERKSLVSWMDTLLATAASLKASEGAAWQVRRGLLSRDRLASVELAVDDLELLMGRRAPARNADSAEAEAARAYCDSFHWPGGQTGHCELDRSRAFALGIDGLQDEIRTLMRRAEGKQALAYQSFVDALDGLSLLAGNAARTARAAMGTAMPERQAELKVLAESCTRIAHLPPASFRDAIQLLWLIDFGVTIADNAGLLNPGHLDRTLWPFYESDLRNGRIIRREALELIESLYLLLNEFIPDGLAIAVMVGGRDASGRDLTNELSYLCLEALRRTKLIYPTVGICWHDGTPQALTDLGIELIAKGYANVGFFGDSTIQAGLEALGVPRGDACNYINSTCVEITPVGGSNVWVASPYYPLCKLLLDEIDAEVNGGTPADDFETLVAQYRERVSMAVERGVREQNEIRIDRQRHGGKPLQSVFTRDCIGRGRDIDDGGALYNWIECSFVGMANLADSMHVIREEVFSHKRMTLRELKAVLDADFAGHEDLRLRLLQRLPKYGNACEGVDGFVAEMVSFLKRECSKYSVYPDGGAYVPGMFCWIMHEVLGRQCGATPDGRRAGFPFADGGGPAQGREKNGPTAAILSTTSWDHSCMIGGLAYNMKFDSSLFASQQSRDSLRELVLTFLRRGGFETQINVVSREKLEQARRNPDQYRDLVVRIGGYTDYFARLSPEMQEEVMMRTEYEEI
ncbi:MAG TPA: pyruvate formate lyase family protein [Planctomycetota bacterium]|nr:pyruvate formate lyase family protein [Planctomycetota bacterium]